MPTATQPRQDPDLIVGIDTLISEVASDPDHWKKSPNEQLGGLKPEDLLGTPDEVRVRELLRAVKHGMPT